MKKPDKIGFGSRDFIAFDENIELPCILLLDDDRELHFNIMVHKCSDDPNGVICWFNCKEK